MSFEYPWRPSAIEAAPPVVLPVVEDAEGRKLAFAEASLRLPDDPFGAALETFDDVGTAMLVARTWPYDERVRELKRELLAKHGKLHFAPCKAMLAGEVWSVVKDRRMEPETRLKAMRVYAEVMGFIEKGAGVTVNNNVMAQNKVMLVSDYGPESAWEAGLAAQQRALIERGRAGA